MRRKGEHGMFGLSVSVALSYLLSVACTALCVIYGIVRAAKRRRNT